MTFLDLVRKTVQVADIQQYSVITSTTGSGDYVSKAAEFVRQAWRDIQQRNDGWTWRIREFSFRTFPNVRTYAWQEMRDGEGALVIHSAEGHDRWLGNAVTSRTPWYVRDPEEPSNLGAPLAFQPYSLLRSALTRETASATRPTQWSVDYQKRIVLNPLPDASYEIDGIHTAGVQLFQADNEEPTGIAESFQDAIVWGAVAKLHAMDEQFHAADDARRQHDKIMAVMARRYLPSVTLAPPLA